MWLKYRLSSPECGIDYSPPSQHVLNVLDAPKVSPSSSSSVCSFKNLEQEEAILSDSIKQYERVQVG